jgi:hypothetical protein
MNLPGYVNIRHAGQESVLREAGLDFDVLLSNELWRRYIAHTNPRVEAARIWDVLFMLRLFHVRPGCGSRAPKILPGVPARVGRP